MPRCSRAQQQGTPQVSVVVLAWSCPCVVHRQGQDTCQAPLRLHTRVLQRLNPNRTEKRKGMGKKREKDGKVRGKPGRLLGHGTSRAKWYTQNGVQHNTKCFHMRHGQKLHYTTEQHGLSAWQTEPYGKLNNRDT